ncbi:MAG: N-6 DNA methylase [Acidobacteriota bacterium]|nr:SAM-dependent methyltransferase [Blastocatellia bacterium]MDW8411584.1 N-6 DNA methylase [Acidobacteriota bacterium]
MSALYEDLLAIDSSCRKQNGVFYTPLSVASFLAERVLELLPKVAVPKVLDPACGTGIILLSVAKLLVERLGSSMSTSEAKRRVAESIVGMDIDPVACLIARKGLAEYLGAEPKIVECDALLCVTSDWAKALLGGENEKFDAVVMNPPYLGEKGNADFFRKYYVAPGVSKYCQGKMDIWYLFVHLALDSINENGAVAVLATDYWQQAKGAALLRSRLEGRLAAVYSFGMSPFSQARGVHSQILLINSPVSNRGTTEFILKQEYRKCSDKLSVSMFEPKKQLNYYLKRAVPLAEIVSIAQGVVPGPARITASVARKYGLSVGEAVFVLPIGHSLLCRLPLEEHSCIRPFACASSLRSVVTRLVPQYRIIDLRGDEDEVRARYPTVIAYLERYKPLLASRRETLKGARRWFELHWPRSPFLHHGPRIISLRQTPKPLFSLVEEDCYFDLSVNILKAENTILLRALGVYLNTRFVREYLFVHGKHKGQIYQVDAEQLKTIPVPEQLLAETPLRCTFVQLYEAVACGIMSPTAAVDEAERLISECLVAAC